MLIRQFESMVAKYEGNIAFDDGQNSYTYRELYRRVCGVARALAEDGRIVTQKRNRIGLLFDNSIEFVATLLACAHHNLSVCLINGNEPVAEVNKYCGIADVTVLLSNVAEIGHKESATDIKVPLISVTEYESIISEDAELSAIIAINSHNEEFVTQFSSGSTGIPKGIVISQEAVAKRALYFGRAINAQASDSFLCVLTFTHAHGSDVLLWPALLNGATLVAPKGTHFTARKLHKLLSEKAITVFSSLPLHYDMLVNRGVKDNELQCRLFMSASAPLSTQTGNIFRELYGLPITQAYGNTEFGVICVNDNKEEVDLRVGRVLTGIQWMQNEDGELLVRSDASYLKYLLNGNIEERRDGSEWFNTKDVVDVDPEQKLSIVDRTSNFINVSGNKVSPSEIEDELKELPGIYDACVFGIKQENRDEQVIACIISNSDDLTEDWIRERLFECLPSYKVPSKISFLSQFPTTSVGKVLRGKVKELYLEELSAQTMH